METPTAASTGASAFHRAGVVPGHYPVNLRVTIPFYPQPLFVTLIIGREKRNPDRLREERERHPLQTWGNLVALATTWSVFCIAGLFAVLVFTAL
jgi:hypothetical protein